VIIITDVVDVFFEHHNQDTILLNVVILSFKSNIHMSFKSIISSTFVVFTELTLALLDQTSYDNRKKFQLNSMKNFVQRQAIIIDIMISLTQSSFDFASVSLKNLLKIHCHVALNEDIRSIHIDVEKEER